MNSFAGHGLEEIFNENNIAGITDGKEVLNLVNKLSTEFDLDPELVRRWYLRPARRCRRSPRRRTLSSTGRWPSRR